MSYTFLDLLTTDGVIEAQTENHTRDQWADFAGSREFTSLDDKARTFLAERDSLYIGSHSESGWPYIQHRGGPEGFIKVIDDTTFGFADFSGNKQYITLGNSKHESRVALFLMDYERRRRMKVLAHLEVHPVDGSSGYDEKLIDTDYHGNVERLMVFKLVAFDWNCPQHITQRIPKAKVSVALAQLQAENAELRRQLKARG